VASRPWDPEQALDPSVVSSLLDDQFPDLRGAPVRYLDEGWDSVVYEVAGSWVVRFPKRREVEETHDVEVALLPRLHGMLPIPIPFPERRGAPGHGYPHRFVGYRRIPGTPAIELPLEVIDIDDAGRRLGAFLARLHAFPAAEALRLGVPAPLPDDPFPRWRAHAAERLPSLRSALSPDLARRAEAFLEGPLPRLFRGEPRLVHYDVGDARVLVEEHPGGKHRVTGVIDWGDVRLGDPAVDFAGLLQWLGPPLLERALDAYGGAPPDEGFPERVRGAAVFAAFSSLWYGVEGSRPEHVRSGVRSLAHALP
jgi:aminoglycoside phosphotransferase (APT) family kinase protein